MKIIINGHEKDFEENISLKYLINSLEVEDKVMAAAVNMNIIKKDNWDSYTLSDNDKVELLEFVGGG